MSSILFTLGSIVEEDATTDIRIAQIRAILTILNTYIIHLHLPSQGTLGIPWDSYDVTTSTNT